MIRLFRFCLLLVALSALASPAEAGRLRDLFHQDERGPTPETLTGQTTQETFAYGADPKQQIDVYRPLRPKHAPILMLVHGGGWRMGDKENGRVVTNKLAYWGGRGMIVISVNYRMLPNAKPLAQAEDVAHALAYVQSHAAGWGGDPGAIVLMGHSAGAHLVALLSADPAWVQALGAARWKGTVVLDSAAMDVPAIMRAPHHFNLYDDAFGDKPADWERASPFHRLTADALPMLLVCSSRRADSCQQAEAFAAKAKGMGLRTEVLREALTHGAINKDLGLPGDYTAQVDAFIRSLLGT